MQVRTEPSSLVQRRPAVPNGDGKILRSMGFQDLGQQDGRHPLLPKQAHPDRCHPEDQRRHDQVREDGEVPRRHLRPGPHMSSTHRLHHRPMQSPTEPHARDIRIDMGSVQKHPAHHLQGTHQIRHRLRKHGLRQCGSEHEGEAGSTSRTGPEDLLRIVTGNSKSIAASGMRSTSDQPPTTTSTVRLRSEDPERQRSPDGEHHEGLLAKHLRHMPAGQRNFLHEGQEGPGRHQR